MWRAASRWRFSCAPARRRRGAEVRTLLKHLVRRIRRHWPRTRLTFPGDSHYGRTEAMAWCEENGVDYIFGLAGNRALHRLAYDVADDLKVRRAEAGADRMRGFASFDYAAGSWRRKRRVVARLEATTRGFDARYIVTSLTGGPRHLYEGSTAPAARPRTSSSCTRASSPPTGPHARARSPTSSASSCTPAYWLMLALRDAVPRRMTLAWAEFATLRQRLLKIGARVVEKAARIRIHFASACPDAALFRMLAGRLAASGPDRRGNVPRQPRSLQPRTPTPITSDPDAASASNGEPCSIKINRQTLPALNKSG